MLENKNASQNVLRYSFVIKLLKENLFLVQSNIVVGYFGALKNGYLIFYFITVKIIVTAKHSN